MWLATVIAQCLSAVLTLYVLTNNRRPILHLLEKFAWTGLCCTASSAPDCRAAAIQQMVTSFQRFAQSYINVFGSMLRRLECLHENRPVYDAADDECWSCFDHLHRQNVGASYIDRAKKGATTAFLLAELVTIVMMIPLLIFAPQMVYLFNQEAAVIRYGTLFLYLLSPFYILCCVNQVYSNVLRGAGDTRTPMIVMLGSFVVFRQIYLFVMSHIFDSIIPIALGIW